MNTIRAKSKKAAPDICPEISNKISTKRALSIVEATRQNVLEAFSLFSNYNKLPLVAIKATSSFLAGFLSVKVSSKRHTWVSSSIASTLTKSPKVFNNRLVNKLVFPSIDSTSGASSTTSSKKMVKKTKSSEKWRQSLVSAIVTPNLFVISNKILDKISIASSGIFAGWVTSTLVPGATFKIKLAHVKAVFQLVHGFLDAKLVSKDNVKLFCVEFASQVSLEAAFLIELTSSVYLAILKITKSLVISESGSPSAAVVLCDVPLGVSAADIKTALCMFDSVTCVVLKFAGVWQYVVVYFKKLNSAVFALNHWSVLLYLAPKLIWILQLPKLVHLESAVSDCEIASSPFLKTPKIFKPRFVGFLSYAKTFALPVMSEFSLLVAFAPPVTIVDPAVGFKLDSLKKQISILAALIESIVKPVGSLIALVFHLLDDNIVKTVQVEKDFFFMKYASNNFANLLVGVSKNIACLRSEVDFGGMDYDDMQTTKPSFLSENTVECIIVL
ncbi:hypothetical protein G9A89_008825 [Geosiphon pyriformis]|nr:hypothetical protein G9A89_008825 [Geosiphon pyriformis]